ncbi:MAG: hypothetical protein JW913_11985 [Chitinispirillaceae bacterium]|nr:hypothetical protein [Chitinispirillaceae bacterium]
MFWWAYEEMKNRGYNKLVLWAFENNSAGDAFYSAMGFKKDGKNKIIPKFNNQLIVRYRRDL